MTELMNEQDKPRTIKEIARLIGWTERQIRKRIDCGHIKSKRLPPMTPGAKRGKIVTTLRWVEEFFALSKDEPPKSTIGRWGNEYHIQ